MAYTCVTQTSSADSGSLTTFFRDDYDSTARYLLVVNGSIEDVACNVSCCMVNENGDNSGRIVFACKSVNDTNAIVFTPPEDGKFTIYAFCTANTTIVQLYIWED